MPSAVHDVAGRVSPRAQTVGDGPAQVLRDGKAFGAQWSRSSADTGTSVTGADGTALPFATGPLWILLVPRA